MNYVQSEMNPIAELMKILMEEKKIKPKDLIRLSGFTRTTVWRHTEGEGEPDLEARSAYAKIFGMEPDEFERRWQSLNKYGGPSLVAVQSLQKEAELRGVTADEFVIQLLRDASKRRAAKPKGKQG